ncbi:hypothetical protein LPJ78_000821 [Coemansia sp. RSA 989]|nr:hypothetical protein LPJ68_003767 [Coemansia sp. RSA 1086]KAJ1753843.1 hypothetical protein LPJ79_000130 [Coemansia sp. RSA 1821]KAJ1867586.1 hypothetical protein LPJ78_000821 [Coemansia sp. RSA 989]
MSIIIIDDTMNIDFDKAALEKSLPDLTIAVKDGNLLYTRPEQLLNRKRCRCFERRGSRAQDLDVTSGKTYAGNETEPYLKIMDKYMSLAEVAYHFLHQGGGLSCGEPCNAPVFKSVTLNTTWHNPNPVSDGYIALSHKDKEIYVVWAGTRRIRSIVVDSMFVFEDFSPDVPGATVHAGFAESTNAVYPNILKNILAASSSYPDYKVVFVGHSLGGASAVLAALRFAKENELVKDMIRVWTFGEPRVGNRAFAEYYTQLLGNQTYRITYKGDIVPHVPPWQVLGYQHHPLEIHIINKEGDFYVCQNTVREDLDGAYRWPTIDTGVSDHIAYFEKPDITRFDPLIEW